MSAELQSPRSQIDEIDRQLVQLVAERMAVVRAIASTKKADTDAPLRDHHREQEDRPWSDGVRRNAHSVEYTIWIERSR